MEEALPEAHLRKISSFINRIVEATQAMEEARAQLGTIIAQGQVLAQTQ